ncbi:zinc metalloprotease [Niabella hibiscisoli]|uniref:M57 family metalloprotease n=1 Tax=Niabella hibiscisoli TaxID=1825928 RepID=UPI001F116F08|nr:M57 family metalloprotease [Niabella hibiscisoli]MCH5717526.1 M57 family metalloprotease [Niabella hibiscisoli]
MQRKIINFLLLFCAAAFISSCKKDLNNDYQNHQEYYTLEAFAKQIGVHPNSIKEFKDFFVVGGDMVFNKRDFQKTSLRQVVVGQTASSNVFGPISLENQRDINIYIDTVARYLPASYTSKFVYSLWAAIENFNTLIPNSYIRMTQVLDSNLADIKIHLVDGLPAPFTYSDGYTLYPVNGKPGSDMWLDLNKAHDNYYPTVAGLTCLTTHELGHAIGLFHTNEIPNDPNQIGTFLKQIPGTPGFASFSNPNPDQYSFIISPGFSIPEWTESTSEPTGNGFSEYDKIAIEYLYPAMYAKVRKVLTNTHYYNQGYYELQLFDLYIEFLRILDAQYLERPTSRKLLLLKQQ